MEDLNQKEEKKMVITTLKLIREGVEAYKYRSCEFEQASNIEKKMGRKIEMKKIEDVTKCQVTFSKRRSSLMKKANEIAVCCDVDVAFVAFSPSGRVSKFCNKRRFLSFSSFISFLKNSLRFIQILFFFFLQNRRFAPSFCQSTGR